MKKTAVHFKIAAWSIKHPVQFYAVVGGSLLVMLALLLVLGRATVGIQPKGSAKTSMGSSGPTGSGAPPVWVSGAEFRQAPNLRCLERKREDTGYRIFSCYENVNGQWKFKHNF